MSANNIFVSYKYHDHDVKPLDGNKDTIARDYVDHIDNIFSESKKVYYRGKRTATTCLTSAKKPYTSVCLTRFSTRR